MAQSRTPDTHRGNEDDDRPPVGVPSVVQWMRKQIGPWISRVMRGSRRRSTDPRAGEHQRQHSSFETSNGNSSSLPSLNIVAQLLPVEYGVEDIDRLQDPVLLKLSTNPSQASKANGRIEPDWRRSVRMVVAIASHLFDWQLRTWYFCGIVILWTSLGIKESKEKPMYLQLSWVGNATLLGDVYDRFFAEISGSRWLPTGPR